MPLNPRNKKRIASPPSSFDYSFTSFPPQWFYFLPSTMHLASSLLAWTLAQTLILTVTDCFLHEFGSLLLPRVPNSLLSSSDPSNPNPNFVFTNLIAAFKSWDNEIRCRRFKEILRQGRWIHQRCRVLMEESNEIGMRHVSVLVKGWTWIPDNLDNLY